ncbi:MAG: trigger factor [Deltaproteobacteria bacterium]|nr:trigger factor [Deltaproteobacteria bacterium]
MKVDLDILSPIRRRIRVELPAQAVNEEFLRTYEGLGRRVKIRGFRPGKAPRSLLEGLYGDEVRGQVRSRLVEQSLSEIIKEKALRVVSHPEVEADPLEEGRTFTFSAVVEVKPDIEAKNYLGLEVERVKLKVEDEQVDEALRRLQHSHAQLEPVEGRDAAERGDFVVLDFTGFVGGKPFSGGEARNYPVEIGSGDALPQFEAALIGLKKDGEHNISVAYPEDYSNRELAGKVVEFSVIVRDIKKKILPPLDDEFAKDHGECGSLEELRQKIRARLESEFKEIQTRDLKEQLLARLIEGHSFEVPAAMVEHQLRYLLERQQGRLGNEGTGQVPVPERLRKELEPQAERQVRATLLVEKIAQLEKISVSDDELRERIDQMARSAGEKGPTVHRIYARDDAREDLRSQMVFERTVDMLFDHAKVTEKDWSGSKVDAQGKKS